MRLLEVIPGDAGAQNLSEADIIISGGRGMKNGDNFKLLFNCAKALGGAAVGASRVAVDEGWMPYAMQVGQTGATVNPKVDIACGISGSVQHFIGMKTAGMITAINTDTDAAIMSNCDYAVHTESFCGSTIATFRFLRRLIAPANSKRRGRAKKTGLSACRESTASPSLSIIWSTASARSEGDSGLSLNVFPASSKA